MASLSTIDRRNFLPLRGAGAATLGVASAHAATASTPPAAKSAAVKLTILYGPPVDPAEFENYNAETHRPIAGKITGFTRAELSKVLPGTDGAKPSHSRRAEFWFESPAAMQACTDSRKPRRRGMI